MSDEITTLGHVQSSKYIVKEPIQSKKLNC